MDLARADRVLVSGVALATGLARAAANGADKHQVVGEAPLRRMAAVRGVEVTHGGMVAPLPAFKHVEVRGARFRRDDVARVVVLMIE